MTNGCSLLLDVSRLVSTVIDKPGVPGLALAMSARCQASDSEVGQRYAQQLHRRLRHNAGARCYEAQDVSRPSWPRNRRSNRSADRAAGRVRGPARGSGRRHRHTEPAPRRRRHPQLCIEERWHGVVLGRQLHRPTGGRDQHRQHGTGASQRTSGSQVDRLEEPPHVRAEDRRYGVVLGPKATMASWATGHSSTALSPFTRCRVQSRLLSVPFTPVPSKRTRRSRAGVGTAAARSALATRPIRRRPWRLRSPPLWPSMPGTVTLRGPCRRDRLVLGVKQQRTDRGWVDLGSAHFPLRSSD